MRILKAGMIAVGSLAVVGILAVTLSAQGSQDNSGNPAILRAVTAVQGTANDLLATLNALVTTVDGISASTTPGNVLFTPAAAVHNPDVVICAVTNLSAGVLSVNLELIAGGGGLSLFSVPQTILPGGATGLSFAPVTSVLAYCKFTVNDGTKNDVRGSLLAGAPASTNRLVVAAQ